MQEKTETVKNKRSSFKLWLVALAMFGFGFALSPMYSLFCQALGLNGRTVNAQSQVFDYKVDESRLIKVKFVTTTQSNLPWDFKPLNKELLVHPGELGKASFYIKNRSTEEITGQAIPSLAPTIAASHFNKTECFCFEQQTLAAGEEAEMPLQFVISPDLPQEVGTVFLTYQFFNASRKLKKTPLALSSL